MHDAPFRVAHVSEIVTPAGSQSREGAVAGSPDALRHRLLRRRGVPGRGGRRRLRGRAHRRSTPRTRSSSSSRTGTRPVKVGDQTVVDAPAGTFVYVGDPAVLRGATALEAGTTLFVVGGEPGKAFEVSAGGSRSTQPVPERAWKTELPLAGAGGEPVDLWRSIQSHGLVDLPPMRIDEEGGRWRSRCRFRRRGRARCGSPRAAPGTLELTVSGRPPGKRQAAELEAAAAHVLRLDEDLSPFYAAAAY